MPVNSYHTKAIFLRNDTRYRNHLLNERTPKNVLVLAKSLTHQAFKMHDPENKVSKTDRFQSGRASLGTRSETLLHVLAWVPQANE
ncbi:hypothetical protein VTL71DRAFT_3337, partial [Oculimacula yallundae]